jgi:hypothetical protein
VSDFDLQHGLAVASRVDGPLAKLVAVLHDSVEDGACTIRDLADAGLAPDALDAIIVLTRQPDEPYADYIGRVLLGGSLARRVKHADLCVNLARIDEAHQSLEPRWRDALARLEEMDGVDEIRSVTIAHRTEHVSREADPRGD